MTSAFRRAADVASRINADLAEWQTPRDQTDIDAPAPLDPEAGLLAAFDDRVMDEDLRAATRSRFVAKHYADAVEAGVKMLNECVRRRTGRTEDGDPLMTVVFSADKPLLRINPMRSQSDRSEQRGHMQLCQGVVAAWRNPRAHSLVDDSPARALMMLELLNDLITVSKGAKRTRQRGTT